MASATVRESIATSAYLKLPSSMSRKEKESRIDAVLEELGLVECKNTMIGDELLGMKGVSGGQRRRVSIGIELIKQPSAIFLDEPTSGLDSEMALAIMETLQNLAKMNRTITVTIHQPNSIITSKFDDFMLLAGGELVYFGEWKGSVPFFAAAGLHCPQFTNPTDYFLSVLQEQVNVDTLVEQQRRKGASSSGGAGSLLENGDEERPLEVVSSPSVSKQATATEEKEKENVNEHPEVPVWSQIWVLAVRNFRNYLRNPVMLFAELAQYLFMGIFIGLMYLQLNNSVLTGVPDRLASLWFGFAVLSFTPSYTAVTIWDRERVLLRREAGQAMYSVSAWFTARTVVTIPMQIVQTLIFGFIAFFMVGYAITLTNILISLASYALFQFI